MNDVSLPVEPIEQILRDIRIKGPPAKHLDLRLDPHYKHHTQHIRKNLYAKSQLELELILADSYVSLVLWRTHGVMPKDNTLRHRWSQWFLAVLYNMARMVMGSKPLATDRAMAIFNLCWFDAACAEIKLRLIFPNKTNANS